MSPINESELREALHGAGPGETRDQLAEQVIGTGRRRRATRTAAALAGAAAVIAAAVFTLPGMLRPNVAVPAGTPSASAPSRAPQSPGAVGVAAFLERVSAGRAGVTTFTMGGRSYHGDVPLTLWAVVDRTDPAQVDSHLTLTAQDGGVVLESVLLDGGSWMRGFGQEWTEQAPSDAPIADPMDALLASPAGTTKVVALASETVDGAPAEHYRLTLDPSRIAAAQGEKRADVWLDAHDRVVRFVVPMANGREQTYTFGGFNEPVQITRPV